MACTKQASNSCQRCLTMLHCQFPGCTCRHCCWLSLPICASQSTTSGCAILQCPACAAPAIVAVEVPSICLGCLGALPGPRLHLVSLLLVASISARAACLLLCLGLGCTAEPRGAPVVSPVGRQYPEGGHQALPLAPLSVAAVKSPSLLRVLLLQLITTFFIKPLELLSQATCAAEIDTEALRSGHP